MTKSAERAYYVESNLEETECFSKEVMFKNSDPKEE